MSGDEFRALREALAWSQVKMAAFCHVSPSAVYKWESRGPEPIRFTYLEKAGLVTLLADTAPKPMLAALRKELKDA